MQYPVMTYIIPILGSVSLLSAVWYALRLQNVKLEVGNKVFTMVIIIAGFNEAILWIACFAHEPMLYELLRQIYTAIEYTGLTYVLLDYCKFNKLLTIIPAGISVYLFNNEQVLTENETYVFFILGIIAGIRIVVSTKKIEPAKLLFTAGVIIYSFNQTTYDNGLTGAELFGYLNILTNLLLTISLGTICQRYNKLSYMSWEHLSSAFYYTLSILNVTGRSRRTIKSMTRTMN
jgi:hypothetical protein